MTLIREVIKKHIKRAENLDPADAFSKYYMGFNKIYSRYYELHYQAACIRQDDQQIDYNKFGTELAQILFFMNDFNNLYRQNYAKEYAPYDLLEHDIMIQFTQAPIKTKDKNTRVEKIPWYLKEIQLGKFHAILSVYALRCNQVHGEKDIVKNSLRDQRFYKGGMVILKDLLEKILELNFDILDTEFN